MRDHNRHQRREQHSAEIDNSISNDSVMDFIRRFPQHKDRRRTPPDLEVSKSEETPDWLKSPDHLRIPSPSTHDIANDLLQTDLRSKSKVDLKNREHAHKHHTNRKMKYEIQERNRELRDSSRRGKREEEERISRNTNHINVRQDSEDEQYTRRVQQPREVSEKRSRESHNRRNTRNDGQCNEERPQSRGHQVDNCRDSSNAETQKNKQSRQSEYDEERPRPKGRDGNLQPQPQHPEKSDQLPDNDGAVTRIESRTQKCLGSKTFKRAILPLMFYCVIITCIGGWLIREFFRIPGLNDEILKLEIQVEKLSVQVEKLTSENDRLEGEVNKLAEINSGLEDTASKLNTENGRLIEFTNDYNATLGEYKEQNNFLEAENYRYGEYTKTLNQTVDNLVVELVRATDAEQELSSTVEQFKTLSETMEAEISILVNHKNDLNETVTELSEVTAMFEDQNIQLSALNEDLGKIVSFIEVEANGVQSSYEELVVQLADTILRKEVLAEIGLKERMIAELSGWECGFLTAFGSQPFAKDEEESIGYSSYDTVMNYISDRLLTDLCIVRGNLELFLKNDVLLPGMKIWEINMKDLAFGVNLYATNVLNHYFPGESETGLGRSDWNIADYECQNLPYEDRYFYESTQ